MEWVEVNEEKCTLFTAHCKSGWVQNQLRMLLMLLSFFLCCSRYTMFNYTNRPGAAAYTSTPWHSVGPLTMPHLKQSASQIAAAAARESEASSSGGASSSSSTTPLRSRGYALFPNSMMHELSELPVFFTARS